VPLNIRVNAIAPGYFQTDMTQVFYENSEWRTGVLRRILQARFAEMSDLQGVSVFLASDAAKYIAGQCIAVDGGDLASI
jgi:NAD(P)-dependent dehydrogenase (short-subunit alcohol dehydrogenase family)